MINRERDREIERLRGRETYTSLCMESSNSTEFLDQKKDLHSSLSKTKGISRVSSLTQFNTEIKTILLSIIQYSLYILLFWHSTHGIHYSPKQ